MWNALGFALCTFTAGFALIRGARASSNYYEAQVYEMTPAIHRRYAAVSLVFAAAFLAGFFAPAVPTVPLLAFYALVAVFYFSSFARGFSDEER